MTTSGLELQVKGATEADLARGVAAGLEVFARYGTTPSEAAAARFKIEGEWEPVSEREASIGHVCDEAQEVAIQACCRDRPGIPKGSHIALPIDWSRQPPRERRKLYWWIARGLEDEVVTIELGDDERFTFHVLTELVAGEEEALSVAREQAVVYEVAPDRVVKWR